MGILLPHRACALVPRRMDLLHRGSAWGVVRRPRHPGANPHRRLPGPAAAAPPWPSGGHRRFLDKMLKDGDAAMKPGRDAQKFLAALVEYDDPVEMLYRLVDPKEHGLKRLRTALLHDGSPAAMAGGVVPLLARLGCDELAGGTCRAPLLQLLEHIYKVPGLLGCLRGAVQSDAVANVEPVCWFLLTLASQVQGCRDDAELREFANDLVRRDSSSAAARALGVVMAGATGAAAAAGGGGGGSSAAGRPGLSIEDLQAGPGGRHDNDHVDYRDIKIMPTSEEALCQRLPYLPAAPSHHTANPTSETLTAAAAAEAAALQHAPACPEAALLDRQFRLLREDLVRPLRETLAALGIASTASGQGPVKKLPPGSKASNLPNVYPLAAVLGTELKPRACVLLSVVLPSGHRASRLGNKTEREAYWRDSGRGTLPLDTLVCIARMSRGPGRKGKGQGQGQAAGGGLEDGGGFQPLVFGTVARRDAREMAEQRPVVGLAFERGQQKVVEGLLLELGRGSLQAEELVLVQVSSNFLSVQPVLSCLQAMTSVPLAEELVPGHGLGGHGAHTWPGTPPTYLPSGTAEEELRRLADSGVVLDGSQQEALRRGLGDRVALIQGPPGTGKTFVGALLCDAIVRHSEETILCVCYTNHALDQFLEALLAKGIKDIVRIGGRSNSQALAPYNLWELAKSNDPNRQRLSTTEVRRLKTLKEEAASLDVKIGRLEELLAITVGGQARSLDDKQPGDKQQQGGGERTGNGKIALASELMGLLRDEYDSVWDQLGGMWLWRKWLTGASKEEASPEAREGRNGTSPDGLKGKGTAEKPKKQVGVVGYGIAEAQLYKLVAGQEAGPSRGEGASGGFGVAATGSGSAALEDAWMEGDVWQRPQPQRVQLAARWLRELRGRWAADLASALARASEVTAELRALHDGVYRSVLQKARVIGCTSTGAALFRELLRDKDVAPGVVMVEEAGELLEAHVLASLSKDTEHLIMIGDHKQLRPKVDCWSLAVQSGEGHDLNVSLFERLVLQGAPHTTLSTQHRMHPDISALVKHTYPQLQDHDSVAARPPLRGVARRLVFVDHREPEAGEAERARGMWVTSAEHLSKVNTHEVAMVRQVVRYLLQQGYAPGQLVVLTPYLGQLVEIQRELAKEVQVLLDDLDVQDLRKAVSASSQQEVAEVARLTGRRGQGVRVATVDNYQGEEADVVVASLVRSNAAGSVGFLREPERINVLLSRARHGMVLIGNSHTLRNAKSVEARRHWGVVLEKLEAGGAVAPGFPAVCVNHGTLVSLATPGAFAVGSPHGGCSRPCDHVLPCGHRCPLRCHPYDRGHERVTCQEVVPDMCDRGHLITRRCGEPKAQVVCQVCEEIRQIEEEERTKQAKLEEEAQTARRLAEQERLRLQGQLRQLQTQQAALEEVWAAKKAAVRLELQKQQAAKQLELQKKYGSRELQEWEAQERQRAAQEMEALEAEAKAEVQAKEQELAEKKRQAAAQQAAAVAEKRRQLAELEAASQREEQRAALELRTLQEEVEERVGEATSRAANVATNYRTVAAWKEAIAKAAEAPGDNASGLSALRQQLRAAAEQQPSAGAAAGLRDAASSLDVVFESQGLGAHVLQYAAAGGDGSDGSNQGSLSVPNAAKRGLALIKDGKWLDALSFFDASAHQQAAAPDGSAPLAADFAALCRAKLDLPEPKAPKPPGAATPTGAGTKPADPQRQPQDGNQTAYQGKSPDASRIPVHHLAAALRAEREARGGGGFAAGPLQRAASNARAAGEALAFLLHSWVCGTGAAGNVPEVLVKEAQEVLGRAAPGLMARGLKAGQQQQGGGGGGGGPGGGLEAQLERMAKRYPAFEKLQGLVGLAPVKKAMLEVAAAVEVDRERGRDPSKRQMNVRFLGNPGTGKTTIARIYAQLLTELKLLPKAEVVETSGVELLNGGVTKLKEQLKKLEAGGVLFLDEAYQLNPKTNPMGAQVLDYLLPEMENRRGKLVVVLAGYAKPMEELMGHNEGLPSRFAQEFNFPDYSDDELHTIFRDLIANDAEPRFKLADARHLRIAARRVGRQRGHVGFGNARAVRNAYEAAQKRQAARVVSERAAGLQPDLLLLAREDLLGPRELYVGSCAALRELQGMVGLKQVKQQVSDLLGLIRTNCELEEQERPLKEVSLNRVFLGNPGTGKTTVAGIYGRILKDLGLLSKGDVMMRVPADFVGSVLGESEKKTAAILEEAVGRVLVIDEAYGLHSAKGSTDPYRTAVIDTIVAKVQGVPGDDRCVLLLGYEGQMEAMMREANPGLARRFQLANAFRFEDYDDVDLMHITRGAARRRGWELDEAALRAAVAALAAERRRPNFGNAGAVNNLLSTAALRMESRMRAASAAERAAAVPVAEDFLPPPSDSDPARVFDDLIGCREVLAKLREWEATIKACQALGRDPLDTFELNFRFVGSPGTGKTTVARRVGALFASLGLLSDGQVMACSASDFVTGYANQSGGKTREVFESALGRVLFIDEAYRLNPSVGGPFMQEVLDEIVQLLTEPRFMGKMVVILGGYEKQIEALMAANPGLKSRFSTRLHFPDFSPEDAVQLLLLTLRREYSLELDTEAAADLPGMAQQLVAAPNWSNGRDVVTWAKKTFAAYASRRFNRAPEPAAPAAESGSNSSGAATTTAAAAAGAASDGVQVADLRRALDEMLVDKRAPKAAAAGVTGTGPSAAGAGGADAGAAELGGQGNDPYDGFVPEMAVAHAPAVASRPAVATATEVRQATAPPAMDQRQEQQQQQEATEAKDAAPVADKQVQDDGFGGLDPALLRAMQDALEAMGADLSSLDAVQVLAGDPGLAEQLLPLMDLAGLGGGGGLSVAVAREMVRQWQVMMKKRMEEERELAKKRQRPVWRCAVCGRYGCPVAPYIERYEEV